MGPVKTAQEFLLSAEGGNSTYTPLFRLLQDRGHALGAGEDEKITSADVELLPRPPLTKPVAAGLSVCADTYIMPKVVPRPLAEIVLLVLQQHQQQRSAHNCPNDTPAAPQLLAATESLRDRWRNDAATLESLRELTTLDLSACKLFEICRHGDGSGDEYEERWASDNLSILLDCMPQLTSLDLRNSQNLKGKSHEERYRDEICDAGLLEAIGNLTSLQVLRVGAVCGPRAEGKGPDRRAAGREGVAVLADALKGLTRLTELKLTVGKSLHAFEEGTKSCLET